MATENLKVKQKSSEAIMCNNYYGVSLLEDQSLIFNRTFPESLGTGKMMVKFLYMVHKSRKKTNVFILFQRNSYQFYHNKPV